MAITSSAKKALRSSKRKRVFNLRRIRTMRSVLKGVGALVHEGKTREATAKLSEAYLALDKAAKRGVIKKNTAARKKSRLSKLIKDAASS